jgi:hypothetical protein
MHVGWQFVIGETRASSRISRVPLRRYRGLGVFVFLPRLPEKIWEPRATSNKLSSDTNTSHVFYGWPASYSIMITRSSCSAYRKQSRKKKPQISSMKWTLTKTNMGAGWGMDGNGIKEHSKENILLSCVTYTYIICSDYEHSRIRSIHTTLPMQFILLRFRVEHSIAANIPYLVRPWFESYVRWRLCGCRQSLVAADVSLFLWFDDSSYSSIFITGYFPDNGSFG